MGKQKKGKTIRGQILQGYLILTIVIIFLVTLSILCMRGIESNYEKVESFSGQQMKSQEVVTAHYKWLEQLSESITVGSDFEGSLNADTCALGKWLDSAEESMKAYPEIKAALESIKKPHEEIHSQAADLVTLSKTDRDSAYKKYTELFKPKVEEIGTGLQNVSASYSNMSEQLMEQTKRTQFLCHILLIVIGIFAIISSISIARKMAERISKPIAAVTRWSEQLSMGVENLKFDIDELENVDNALEIDRMIESFRLMSDNIKKNVEVIQKVADGDLTAYVDIKSDGDSLGRSLYHLVQNNDFMFADLLRIADCVAANANQIADASQMLAANSSNQADAVETLSTTVHKANTLAADNAESAKDVTVLIKKMDDRIGDGQEKMGELVGAVDAIKTASNRISAVMKSINDIAFQTNVLALNAAVEAARAGQAGKGFAVVADEVRNLALKSQEAAEQSRTIIEDTIAKAEQGGEISEQASDTFRMIVEQVEQIETSIYQIDQASDKQQHLIEQVTKEIERISGAVTENAAASEQTAASTEQMNANASEIHQAMKKFNLRKRVIGQPYIPPEKKDDSEFIEEATKNYNEAMRTGMSVD